MDLFANPLLLGFTLACIAVGQAMVLVGLGSWWSTVILVAMAGVLWLVSVGVL